MTGNRSHPPNLASLSCSLLLCFALANSALGRDIDMVMPGPANVTQVQFTDVSHGVAMGIVSKGHPGSDIVWSNDGGDSWNDAAIECSLEGYRPETLFMANAKIGWAAVYVASPRRQALLKTEDGGKSWKQQTSAELEGQSSGLIEKAWYITGIWFDREGKFGWINAQAGPLLMTADGGRNWQAISALKYEGSLIGADGKVMSPDFQRSGMHVFSAEHVILCGFAGAILETIDAGKTWKLAQIPLDPTSDGKLLSTLQAIHFTSDGKSGWAIGGEGEMIRSLNGHSQLRHPVVIHTSDGGKTWRRSAINVRAPLNDVWAISDQEAWVCGLGGYALPGRVPGTLQHTIDGGKTWINEHPGTGGLRKLFFLDPGHGFVAGGVGGGLEAESAIVIIKP